MRLVDPIIAELEQEAESTRRVLERIPEDRLSWRPHPKSMSLGQLALHIATTPGGVAQIAVLDTMERPGADRPEPKNKREVLEALGQSLSSAMDVKIAESEASISAPEQARPKESPNEPPAELTPAASLTRSSEMGERV